MNCKRNLLLLTTVAASATAVWADTEPIVLMSPPDYQVLAISPNGKWATGVYSDYAYSQRGFIWNLESNSIELLSTGEESQGWSVADDGTVCGSFTDHSTSDIGAGTVMPGYYRDGQWHGVEVPMGFTGPADNYHGAGQGYAISADGTTMTGALYIDGNYSPAVWREGKLVDLLNISNDGMQGGAPYCISPDGTMVGGWSYRYNRACTLWNLNDGSRTIIGFDESPWSSVNRFSPDGKKVLYGGGWDTSVHEDDPNQFYYSIYDIETGEATSLPAMSRESSVNLFGISNSYTCVGSTGDYDGGRAIIYPNGAGPGLLLEDYLRDRGVDWDELHLVTPEDFGYMLLFRGQDISADDNVYALLGYDAAGMRSIIVMLNQDSEHAAPLDVKVRQLSGITTTELTWNAPIRSLEGLKGYRIYRDGVLVSEVGSQVRAYYDQKLGYGTYVYSVASVYEDGTEMKTAAPSLAVAPQLVARPEDFKVRQKGVYSLTAEWQAPGTNLINKSWYTSSTANLRGFGIGIDGQTIECGVGFLQQEMANYADYSISKVTFYPMSEQLDWTVNIYKYEGVTPIRIYSQPITQELVYKQRNTVVLNQPVPVPTDGDVVVAIEVMVPWASMQVIGADFGHNKPGYSDLLRLSSEPDFYSYYYTTLAYGVPEYASFMVEAILTSEGQDVSSDEVTAYRLSLDGEEVQNSLDCSWHSGKVASGDHRLALQAVFADGKVSDPVTSDVTVAYNYPTIKHVDIALSGTTAEFSWTTPIDDDATEITYARGQAQQSSITGPAENNYGFMAGVEYDQTLLAGYQGYAIKSFRFFPLGNATFYFLLYSDQDFVVEVPVYDYNLYEWNEIVLDEPILVSPNTTYLLVLDCYDAEADVPPLAVDNRLPLVFTSDLISLDGESWSSITVESGLSGNWMMSMVLSDPEAQPMPVDGFDVVVDSKKVAEKITDNSYSHDFGRNAAGEHKVRVNTYYTGRYSAMNGLLTTFTIDMTGIQQLLADSYRLSRGTDVLCLEGGQVQRLDVVAADGKVMARAAGNKVGIAALPAGVYMVKAVTVDGVLSYKIVIE